MELDCRYVLHIPLSRWENDSLIALDVDILDELINLWNFKDSTVSISPVVSYYKSCRFNEVILTIFARSNERPHEIFKKWFQDHNDVLGQEAFAYEIGNKMIIEKLWLMRILESNYNHIIKRVV